VSEKERETDRQDKTRQAKDNTRTRARTSQRERERERCRERGEAAEPPPTTDKDKSQRQRLHRQQSKTAPRGGSTDTTRHTNKTKTVNDTQPNKTNQTRKIYIQYNKTQPQRLGEEETFSGERKNKKEGQIE